MENQALNDGLGLGVLICLIAGVYWISAFIGA